MGSLVRTVRFVAAPLALVVWLAALPAAASAQDLVVTQIHGSHDEL